MPDQRSIDRIARRQRGLITRDQLVECGLAPSTVRAWAKRYRLTKVQPGVYRLPGAPITFRQELLAALLAAGPGAVASHRSAAVIWGLDDEEIVEITVPRGRMPRLRDVVVHRSGDIRPEDCIRRRGILVTKPMRTLVDLGAVVSSARVGDAVERALVLRLTSVRGLEVAYDTVARKGRAGAGVLRAVLDNRALGSDRADSLLESRFARVVRLARVPFPAFQHWVRIDGENYRIDFAYPALKIAIEVDGFRFHASPSDMQRNIDKQNALIEAGWTVFRFSWFDIVKTPKKVAATLTRVLGSAIAA